MELHRETEVTALDLQRGIVTTNRGSISTRIVVNAAGAWSPRIAAMAGVTLLVEPLRRMLVPTEPTALIPHNAPMVVDMTNGFHFRPGRCRHSDGLERSGGNLGLQNKL